MIFPKLSTIIVTNKIKKQKYINLLTRILFYAILNSQILYYRGVFMFKKDFPWTKIARAVAYLIFFFLIIIGIISSIPLFAVSVLGGLLSLAIDIATAFAAISIFMVICNTADDVAELKKSKKETASYNTPSWVCKCGTRNSSSKKMCENCGRERE